MKLKELKDYIIDLVKSQQGIVDKINSTNIGVEDLFSEYWLLKDFELLQEQIDNNESRVGILITLLCIRNPRLATFFSPSTIEFSKETRDFNKLILAVSLP